MDFQSIEFTSDKVMNEYLSCIQLNNVRSLVTNDFVNFVCEQSKESNARPLLYQLKLLEEAVKSAIKVKMYRFVSNNRQCRF